ncbi:MAG: hypothetical protein SOX32_12800 [Candidatus Choladocola sp.]|nr:hypothetical protein [Candidatus Choladocola sp.]
MNKIKLKNGTTYAINDGVSIGRIEIPAQAGTTEEIVSELNEKGNLDEVQFLKDDEVIGEYTDMKLALPCSVETTDDGMLVVFGLIEKSETEKRLDAIEAGQDIQDGAISELAEVVSAVVEGV